MNALSVQAHADQTETLRSTAVIAEHFADVGLGIRRIRLHALGRSIPGGVIGTFAAEVRLIAIPVRHTPDRSRTPTPRGT